MIFYTAAMPRYPQLEVVLNERGQLKLLLFFLLLVCCHFGGALHLLDYRFERLVGDTKALSASAILLSICGVQVALLALFNRFSRQPIARYVLLGVAMELLALLGSLFLAWLDGGDLIKGAWRFFKRINTHHETWTLLICPATIAVFVALCVEYIAGEYTRTVDKQQRRSDLLDDI